MKRKIEDGMSCFDVLQLKMASLQDLSRRQYEAIETLDAEIATLKCLKDDRNTPRRERLEIEGDLEAKNSRLFKQIAEYSNTNAELRGMRKAFDIIITITNTGGAVNQKNQPCIEQILNY